MAEEKKSHEHKYAGNLKRLAAAIIDLAIWLVFALVLVITETLAAIFAGSLGGIIFVLGGFFAIGASLVYFIWFEASHFQATPGKMAMGLIVTDAEGRRISLAKSFMRYIGKWISSAVMWLGFAPILFTKNKQGLHDMIAGTVVIERPKAPEAAKENK